MLKRGLPKRLCAFILLLCLAVVSMASAHDGPTISTDKSDYAPGEAVQITGTGWYPNQTVTLQVVHSDGTTSGENHEPFTTTSDADGNIAATWSVETDDG